MLVLVTGATGRVGANVARRLTSDGHVVRAMVQPDDPASKKLDGLPEVERVTATLGDADAVHRAVKGVDAILHLAAVMVRGTLTAEQFFDINVMGTQRLLEAASVHSIERFVFASTDGTYGPVRPLYLPIDEAHPQGAGDRYSCSKVAAEVMVKNYGEQFDLPWTILRYGSVIAPDEVLGLFRVDWTAGLLSLAGMGRDSHLWKLFEGWPDARSILRDVSPQAAVSVVGPGGPWALHMTDVRDVVDGTILGLTSDAALNNAFNIVGPNTVRFDEGAAAVAAAVGVPLAEVQAPRTWAFEVSHKKASDLLGFQPQWDFPRMVDFAANATANDVIPAHLPEA